ncbi:M23 family metallopeptidase [Prosthecochloris vibrioformis]|uniref:M23 family peptidase n=1 Tax=Prosthecochloris vibrioformis TaxID=1098 RepID=A0A5C4S408_PROVB|nr:peptidoglycan DD-metalloendopeptidase family protein [Prosthecochloris vibrioformis]TNJ37847.1 M23 family peptidase [Prosthecochloris vibrioformis]
MKYDNTPQSEHKTKLRLKPLLTALTVTAVLGTVLAYTGGIFEPLTRNYGDELGVIEATEPVEIEQGETPEKIDIAENSVKRGESLYVILTRNGITPAEVSTLARRLRSEFSLRNLHPGQRYQIEKDLDGRFMRFALMRTKTTRLNLEKSRESGEFHIWNEVLEYDTRVASISGLITSSLSDALQEHDRYTLITPLQNLFTWKINFSRDIRPGTTYKILFEEQWLDNELASTGNILAAEISIGGNETISAYRFTDAKGSTGYYDENGKSLNGFFLSSPCNYSRVSSSYGYRTHPILRKRHFHGGVDLAAPTGTPVYAVADGKIVFRGIKGAAGKMVTIDHPRGYHTKYLHLSRFASGARYGSRVQQGDIIGYVGTTGRSTGPHLDFRVVHNGKLQNPLKTLRSSGATKAVAPEDMQEFLAHVSSFRSQLDEERIFVADASKVMRASQTLF